MEIGSTFHHPRLIFPCHTGSAVGERAAEVVAVEVINVNFLHLLTEHSNQQDLIYQLKPVGLFVIC